MRSTLLLLCALAFAATPASGAPSYSISFWNGGADLGAPTSGSPISDSTSGTGVSAGVTSPNVDRIVPIPGDYPVNTPFSLQIATDVGATTYGNADDSPGTVQTDAGGAFDPAGTGVSLGMVGGQIMTLPAGYDFSIPSWHVSSNTYLGPVAVGASPPPADLEFALAGANPSSATRGSPSTCRAQGACA
jgi:hypothetical protein